MRVHMEKKEVSRSLEFSSKLQKRLIRSSVSPTTDLNPDKTQNHWLKSATKCCSYLLTESWVTAEGQLKYFLSNTTSMWRIKRKKKDGFQPLDTVEQSPFSLLFLLIPNRPIWPTAHQTFSWQDKGPQWWGRGTSETVLVYTKEIKTAEDSWFIFFTVVFQSGQGAQLRSRSGSASLWAEKTQDCWLMMCALPSSSLHLSCGVFARTHHHVPHTLACCQPSEKARLWICWQITVIYQEEQRILCEAVLIHFH